VVAAILLIVFGGCSSDGAGQNAANSSDNTSSTAARTTNGAASTVSRFSVRVRARYRHDPEAFTEGLTFAADGSLYESTGMRGASQIRRVEPTTGEVLDSADLDAAQFGEGIAVSPDGTSILQLTWQEGIVRTWQRSTLTPLGTLPLDREGWGLTFDASQNAYLQSDGSSSIAVRDPASFSVTRTVVVTRDSKKVSQLNELEAVDGTVYANVWHSEDIMMIDARTGEVTGVIDASGLWTSKNRGKEMTLNGIAHRPGDPPTRLWLTGKNWPWMYEVDVEATS
jgi:glutamine cyclotransferase